MQRKNKKEAGLAGWLTRAQYWASPEGQQRKERRRLDTHAARSRDLTPRLVKDSSGRAKRAPS